MDDHDLLIRLDTKVDGLTAEIKTLRDDTIGRVVKLENGKVDRGDFDEFKKYLAKEIAMVHEHATQERSKIVESSKEFQKDVEARLRAIERFVYIAIGIITVVDIIGIPLILKFLL